MKNNKSLFAIIAACVCIAVLAAVIVIVITGKNNDTQNDPVNTVDPQQTSDIGGEVNTEPNHTPDLDATPDPDSTPDPDATPDPTDDSGAGLIESGGDIIIVVPTGQGSGGL